MQTYSSWRSPTALRNSPPRTHQPTLMHAVSMVDLHEQSSWSRSSPSPSDSSSSSSSTQGDTFTPTSGSSDLSYPSRNNTPTPTPVPIALSFATPTFAPARSSTSTNNPWYRAMSRPSPPISPRTPISPRSSPQSRSPQSQSPESTSRSTTPVPVAPIPVRPIMGDVDMNQSRFDLSMFENPIRSSPPTPSPYRDAEYDKLPIQEITVDLQREVVNWVHPLCRRKNWSGRIIMPWVVTQPKTALLLWMCDELDAWPKAAQFWSNLMQDSKLPYSESTLRGIAANPAKVVELQWRVGILKTLPRNGGHVEFQTQDTVPLTDHGAIGPRTGSSTIKTRIKVKYRDGADNCYYVRKRLEIHAERPTDKLAILGQIKNFHALNHPNIAKIVSSYAQGQVVSFIMPYIEFNLDEYLDQLIGFSESERILNWVKDLASALTYIHAHNVEHKTIRPQKILVDVPSSRIYFSVFGVSPPLRKSYTQLYAPYSNDPGYIYGAPEIVSNRNVRYQQADIFSLGCVFLEMVSVARNKPVDAFRSHRAAKTHDYSFHMNLDQVLSWIDLLKSSAVSTTPQRRVKLVKKSDRALAVAKAMLYKDPASRPSMKSVVRHLTQTRPSTKQPRRNSADARTVGILPSQSVYFNDMYSLQSYYVAQSECGED